MEILFIGVIVVILAFILESNSNSKKAQKKEEKKKNFEEQRTTCTQIGKLDDYYLYHDTSTEDIFIWNLLDDKICCTIKHCKYERIISAYPYFLIFDNENHCCPEKFYHSVSCLGPSPSGTLVVMSV